MQSIMSGLSIVATAAATKETPSSANIETLAPKWTGVFGRWDRLKRFQKDEIVQDLGYVNTNIVAEARGYCRYYDPHSEEYCETCHWYSWSYQYVINETKDNIFLDKEIVELKGKQYASHFYEHHNGIGKHDSPWKSITSGRC